MYTCVFVCIYTCIHMHIHIHRCVGILVFFIPTLLPPKKNSVILCDTGEKKKQYFSPEQVLYIIHERTLLDMFVLDTAQQSTNANLGSML